MTTITINWFSVVGFLVSLVAFFVVSLVVTGVGDHVLGVTKRLADLPGWKVMLHEVMYSGMGIAFYLLFFR